MLTIALPTPARERVVRAVNRPELLRGVLALAIGRYVCCLYSRILISALGQIDLLADYVTLKYWVICDALLVDLVHRFVVVRVERVSCLP